MTIGTIIGLAALGAAVYFYKQSSGLEDQLSDERKKNEAYVNRLLEENQELENKIDPNSGDSDQAPLVFTATLISGGAMLEQNKVILRITNISDIAVNVGDFRAYMWVAGLKCDLCFPSNLTEVRIPAKKTVEYTLYAGYGKLARRYSELKTALKGITPKLFKDKNINISFTPDPPVYLNMQYLWIGKGFEDECTVFDVPCGFSWKYAGWVAGKVGYNAANKNQQEANPSYWQKFDDAEQPANEEVDE